MIFLQIHDFLRIFFHQLYSARCLGSLARLGFGPAVKPQPKKNSLQKKTRLPHGFFLQPAQARNFFHVRFSALPPEFHRPEMLHWKWQHFHPDQLCSTGASRTDGIVMSLTKRFTACFKTPSLEVCSFIEPLSLYGTDCVTECLIMIAAIRYRWQL